jgi:hypothetical protein
MLSRWTQSKLETVTQSDRVLVRDPLRLLSDADGVIHGFARDNGFTVIVSATNLVFRELYEKAAADPETKKLLVIDRAPARRRTGQSAGKAPPPFYPDLLDDIPEYARMSGSRSTPGFSLAICRLSCGLMRTSATQTPSGSPTTTSRL